jgi:hypothetical protein
VAVAALWDADAMWRIGETVEQETEDMAASTFCAATLGDLQKRSAVRVLSDPR